MLDFLKNKLLRRNIEQPTLHPPMPHQDIDPRNIGYTDAVNAGWYQEATGELLKGFTITADDTVLDAGCGDGLATLFAARQGAHIIFTDVDAAKIESVKQKAAASNARAYEGHVSNSMPLPLSDGSASKILAMEMLEHTEQPATILQELIRVGKPGAQYLITVPDASSENLQKSFADKSYFEKPNHIQIFSKEDFTQLIEDSGLVIESYTTWGFYWTMFMSIFWCIPPNKEGDETLGLLAPPFHPALSAWAKTWEQIQQLPDGQKMVDEFNNALPKAQAIIARKPE